MKQFSADKIKNIALAGHSGSGKTSFAEALLFKAKMTDRLGKVSDGNTVCDFDAEEIKRKTSLSTALAYYEYKDLKINIIDTPGLFGFAGGLAEGISAGGSILITVSAKDGVKVGTEKAFEAAGKKPKMFVITNLDDPNANFDKIITQLKDTFGNCVAPICVPHFAGGKLDCIVNIPENCAFAFDSKGVSSQVDIPADIDMESYVTAISEAVAETSEEYMEKFFAGEPFTHDEMLNGMHKGLLSGSVIPVICVSSTTLVGIETALHMISTYLPCSADQNPIEAGDTKLDYNENSPLAAFVFKTCADPFGKLSYIKVMSGKLTSGSDVVNSTTQETEKIGKLYVVQGKKQIEVTSANAGDIVVATKLSANTSDTLCDASRIVACPAVNYPRGCFSMAVKAKSQGDEGKIGSGMQRLLEEDPTLSYKLDKTTKEMILCGLGELHLDVAIAKLKSKFGADVTLSVPKVAYKETIRKKTEPIEGKHKKQSGGHGQFGHVKIIFEPCESDELVFEEQVFGGAVPKNFFPAVEKGLQESVKKGILAGCPVVKIKATLVDGSYHPVDSSEMAFKTAASLAFKQLKDPKFNAQPVLLEPIGNLSVIVPNDCTGDIMGDLNKRRGKVLGMNPVDGKPMTEVLAEVPIREMHDYTTFIRQVTMGKGSFTLDFLRYDPLPAMLLDEVIAEISNEE